MVQIRKMEEENGAMGLSEQLEEDLSPKKDEAGNQISNNIDVHMMRNTEYGAIAILSTSGYGNPNTMQNSTPEKSTTGNKTGVYFSTDSAYYTIVAGGYLGYAFKNVNSRYYDAYDNSKKNKIGDAMLKWQGASVIFPESGTNNCYQIRGGTRYFSANKSSTTTNYYSRGVAVCGAGL